MNYGKRISIGKGEGLRKGKTGSRVVWNDITTLADYV
jgi:hypothetical protein